MRCSRNWAYSSGANTTSFSSPCAISTRFSNSISPIQPRSFPDTAPASLFVRTTCGVMVAAVSGKANDVETSGSEIVTDPSAERKTSFHIPVSRPRTEEIQSHPILAWNVGLSAPSIPPLISVVAYVFSFVPPILSGLITSTANTLVPSRSIAVMSVRERMKAPSMRFTRLPLRKTLAFQFIPSKHRKTCLPFIFSGTENVRRYQKLLLKNDSEAFSRLSATFGSGKAPIFT